MLQFNSNICSLETSYTTTSIYALLKLKLTSCLFNKLLLNSISGNIVLHLLQQNIHMVNSCLRLIRCSLLTHYSVFNWPHTRISSWFADAHTIRKTVPDIKAIPCTLVEARGSKYCVGLPNFTTRQSVVLLNILSKFWNQTSENVLFYNGHLIIVDLKQLFWFCQYNIGVLRYSFYRIVPVAKQQQQKQTNAKKCVFVCVNVYFKSIIH